MKEETKNKIRKLFNMQQYCTECKGEIPYQPSSLDTRMIEDDMFVRCSTCKGAKRIEQ